MSRYVAVLVILVVILSSIHPIYAAQLDVAIPKNSDEFVPTFQFTRIVTIHHDEDSKLAEIVGDKQQRISFDIDSENSKILVDLINSKLEGKSFVKVTDISGKYTAIITPREQSIGIEYNIVLRPVMSEHFIENFATLDSQWRGFSIYEEIPIETKYGLYDINSPKSVIIATNPQVIQYLSESKAMEILNVKLIDASGIKELPLSQWESMFDPTALMSEKDRYGFSGNVLTNYSMGICTIFGGICVDKNFKQEFVINGEQYTIQSIESQDDATIVIEGYVNEGNLGKLEIFAIKDKFTPIVNKNDESVMMMYVVAGIGAIVAMGFFVWSNKKTKNTSIEQTGIDPKDLRAVSIGSEAGSYKTNRGTAHVINK